MMVKQTIKNLQKAAEDVSCSKTPQEKIESLSKAFEMFSKETSRLEESYLALKEQFKNLNLELEETNRKLKGKVYELDLITYYLNSILSNISQGILFIDLNGTVTTYNRAASNILGISGTKVLFSNFWENFKDEAFGFSLHESLATRKSPNAIFTSYTTPKGVSYELEIEVNFVLKDSETPDDQEDLLISTQGIIILIRDITEISRLQGVANRNDRLKELGEMAAQVAHEIRNPLGGIKGFASLLERDLKDQPHLKQMASYIVEGTNNLNRLVSQVLQFARPVQLHMETVDLADVLEEMKQHILADERISKQKIDVSIKVPNMLISIDPQLIKSALLNLLVNSLESMPNGGKLTLTAERLEEENQATLKVIDTGVGIPKKNMEKIFSPFFTTKANGNGLGLAEVLKVIQAHDGNIECESMVDQGTTFIIKLPLKKRH